MDATTRVNRRSNADHGKAGVRKSLGALADLRNGFSLPGRKLLNRILPFLDRDHAPRTGHDQQTINDLAKALLSVRGEASGVAIATDLLNLYEQFDTNGKRQFFGMLADEFDPDANVLSEAWDRYKSEGPTALPALSSAAEAPRQEFFRRLNQAPGGTAALIRMRADLLALRRDHPALDRVECDLKHLLQSWFNRGFLKMQSIDWSSPAILLERLIRYEAVHDINSWSELRLRLAPADRRCFAFFHPVMPDEPLIFVEVGLTIGMPSNIQEMLAEDRSPIDASAATTATFYSINNCQAGLSGISFGHFLIKQVAADLKRELPGLTCFVTLSPIPSLMKWLRKTARSVDDHALVDSLSTQEGLAAVNRESAHAYLLERATGYFLHERDKAGRPCDPVARFHLGNGARLERVNLAADTSPNGLRQSGGLMVNYLYDLSRLEENHEAFVERGKVVTGKPFEEQARAWPRQPSKG